MPQKQTCRLYFLLLCLSLGLFVCRLYGAETAPVKVWEERIVIPTYPAGAPEANPMFYFGRQSQGAEGRIYPYPFYDSLTGEKVDKSYTLVYLENEYLRIGILPEIGGRLLEGIDKTNGYHFFYRQHVIKPALIGLIGAWISGGIEWNIPHHHRASTFLPVQYQVEESVDGSKTVWVGELEIRHRMRWAVGYTLRPGKAYLEAKLRILNRTPLVNTMLCFANVAVHANDTYQVIFPPGTAYATFHAKREFTAWPFSTTRFAGADFTRGVDISWYKNNTSSNSFFAWNYEDDFFAGYDHGKQAGVMSVADHHIVPGKKLWTWGTGPRGRSWEKILTDRDGPYIELMVGAYSDNQPDYSWLQPFETKSFSMNWYPFRDIGGVKQANLEAAVNLEVADGKAKAGLYTTSSHPAARVILTAKGQTLLQETISIHPGKPYVRAVPLPSGVTEQELAISLSADDKELISYRPVRHEAGLVPKPVDRPEPPASVKTNEELFLIGQRIDQFHDPNLDPDPYWQEALRRDPQDVRVNTALGILYLKKARYQEAENCLRTALQRLTADYTSPKDGEATYYLGLALQAQAKDQEAFATLYRATWSLAWRAPAYYLLAELASRRGSWEEALQYTLQSLESNALNLRAWNLQAALLRHLGRQEAAQAVLADGGRLLDPLDVRSLAEKWLATGSEEAKKKLVAACREHPATAQETAAEYLQAGLWRDGYRLLEQLIESAPNTDSLSPMIWYYQAYFAEKLGEITRAQGCRRRAAQLSPDYVFPFQAEAIEVLQAASRAEPADARALYYLGNYLYDLQPEKAMVLWEASRDLDPTLALVHRNLAQAYLHQKGSGGQSKAIASLEKAVACERKYALHFTELDELYEQARESIEKRLAVLDKYADVVRRRDDAANRLIALQILAGRYDEAIWELSRRKFAIAEGVNLNAADPWRDAHLLRGQRHLASGQAQEALLDFQAATAIPENIPVENIFLENREAEIGYWKGLACAALKDTAGSEANWRQGANPVALQRSRPSGEKDTPLDFGDQLYYRAFCLKSLGQTEKAGEIFEILLQAAQSALRQDETGIAPSADTANRRRSRKTGPAQLHYLAGLGQLGLGATEKAKEEFSRALSLKPDLLGALAALHSMEKMGAGK